MGSLGGKGPCEMHAIIHIVGTVVLLGWGVLACGLLAAWVWQQWRRWHRGRWDRRLAGALRPLPKKTPGGVRIRYVSTGSVRVHYRGPETPVDPWELPPDIRDLWLHARLALMRREQAP